MFQYPYSDLTFTQQFGAFFIIFSLLAFFAILFLQSGLDKIYDRKGNLEWLKGHFEKSALAGMVPALLTTITVMEMLSGVLSAASAILIFFVDMPGFPLPFYAMVASTVSLLMLFFGQRMAKDYGGAAGIVPYFLVTIIALAITYVLA
jgi:hypothetical protein